MQKDNLNVMSRLSIAIKNKGITNELLENNGVTSIQADMSEERGGCVFGSTITLSNNNLNIVSGPIRIIRCDMDPNEIDANDLQINSYLQAVKTVAAKTNGLNNINFFVVENPGDKVKDIDFSFEVFVPGKINDAFFSYVVEAIFDVFDGINAVSLDVIELGEQLFEENRNQLFNELILRYQGEEKAKKAA